VIFSKMDKDFSTCPFTSFLSEDVTLKRDLIKEFPEVLKHCQYIEIGEGWHELCRPVLSYLQGINENRPNSEKVYIVQIKEKFGGLRIDWETESCTLEGCFAEKLWFLIDLAEKLSWETCEVCGAFVDKKGPIRLNSWYRTVCEEHAK
jgi:hypothetical protein